MTPLTPGETKALDFIRGFMLRHRVPPTNREICEGLGFASPNAAAGTLRRLEEEGAITIERHKSRGIRIVGDPIDCICRFLLTGALDRFEFEHNGSKYLITKASP